jgi:gliding motility-associated-like protein
MNITVTDDELPNIICPASVTVDNTIGICESTVVVGSPIVSDNCGVATVINDYNNGGNASGVYPVGNTTVNWTVTDIHGNTSSCAISVVVNDVELPQVTCGTDIIVNNTPGTCGADVVVAQPVYSDNCGIQAILNDFNSSTDASGNYPAGITTVTWFVTDINGNTSTCIQTVTVEDIEAPVADNCDYIVTVNNDPGQCGAAVTYDLPLVTDNCGAPIATLISGPASGDFFPIGITPVVYEFSDANGNVTTCGLQIEVLDAEGPSVNCPNDTTLTNDPGICGAVVNYDLPIFTDNCGNAQGTVQLVAGLPSGQVFPVGTTTVTYDVTDANGNTFSCSFDVNVTDVENPEIVCPDNIIQQDPIVNYPAPTATDNCSIESIVVSSGLESGDVFPHGYTDVEIVAIDLSGNTDTCSFSVLVNNPPTANPDAGDVTEENEDINISVLFNDFDIDGDSIFITGLSAAHGGVMLNDDGTISYTIDTEVWCGVDTITYTICDIYNACDTSFILVDVECFLGIEIPEGFSPNGDGVNDLFEILGLEDYPNNKLSVFNRWGHKVFEAERYDNTWNGVSQSPVTIGSGMLPKGTYYYVFDPGDGEKTMKGYIFINR